MMEIEPLLIADPHAFADERGVFTRIALPEFVVAEENYSLSRRAGTIRGLHWQEPMQAKFVRVLSGAIVDACVRLSDGKVFVFDMRAGEASLLVPEGFAHGFCTVEDSTLVSYKVSAPFAAGGQSGIHPFDPQLAIAWPVGQEQAILSQRDASAPGFMDAVQPRAA